MGGGRAALLQAGRKPAPPPLQIDIARRNQILKQISNFAYPHGPAGKGDTDVKQAKERQLR